MAGLSPTLSRGCEQHHDIEPTGRGILLATLQNKDLSLCMISLNNLWIALICWLAVGLLIFFSATPPTGPTIYPDEICNLSWARFLSGTGPHYNMSFGGACHLVYPALLAPLYWFDPDPVALYRGIFLINSLLVAACFPLAVRLAVRHFGVEGWQAGLIGLAVMAYPTLTLFNHHAWPESALYPLVLVAFISYCHWIEQPDWRRFIVLGLVSLLLYLTHPKMLVFPLAWLALLGLGLLFSHRLRLYHAQRALLWSFVAMILLIIGFQVGSLQLAEYTRQSSLIEFLQNLIKLSELDLRFVTAKLSGQLFYAALVTGGLIWVSFSVGIGSLLHAYRHGPASIPELEKKNLFVLVMVLLMALETAIFLASAMRFDTFFYGRHVDNLMPVTLVAALALFFKQRISLRIAGTSIVLILSCFALLALTLPAPAWSGFSRIHVFGMEWLIRPLFEAEQRWDLILLVAWMLSATGLVGFAAIQNRWRWLGWLPLVAVLSLAQFNSRPVSDILSVSRFLPDEVINTLNSAATCRIHWDESIMGTGSRQFFRMQFYFPHCELDRLPPSSCSEVEGFVISQQPWDDCPVAESAVSLPPDLLLYHTSW